MRNTIKSAVVMSLMAGTGLISSNAAAQADPSAAGLYIGGSFGEAHLSDACSGASGIVTNCDNNDSGWKAFAGYQFNPWFSLEAALVDFGEIKFTAQQGGNSVTSTNESQGITFHAVGQIPIPFSGASANRFSILGKLGTIWWDAESNSNAGSQSDDDFDLSYGVGLQFTLSERFLIRAEWERFNNVGIANAGRSDVDLWTAGLAFKF